MPILNAQIEDLPALNAIYDAAVTGTDAACDVSPRPASERNAWWQAHQDPHFPILVFVEDGEIAGYATLSRWHDGVVYARTVEVGVYLALEARGRGLGTHLLRELLTEATRLGHHAVVARIWAGNAASLALCRRCGFEIIGVQREVGLRRGAWEDCVLLQVIVGEMTEV